VNYLFYIPLFFAVIKEMLKKWAVFYLRTTLCLVIGITSGITTLLLWVPVVFLVWVGLVQPMLI
jgi:hypothetical protein